MNLELDLKQALDAQKQAILDFSQDLIRIASENPPGNYYTPHRRRVGVGQCAAK